MILVSKEDLPRPTHKKILEVEQAKIDHAVDVLPICHHIVAIRIDALSKEEF